MQSRYTRFHGSRQQQLENLRQNGWRIVRFKTAPVVVAFNEHQKGVFVKLWHGNADRPAHYHHFHTMKAAEDFVTRSIRRISEVEASKAARRADRKAKRDALKASDHWTVGEVFYNSWGYDQTNIDWYQVVEVKAKSVVIRAIHKNYKETGFMSGNSQPRRNDFNGEPVVKQLDECGRISMRHGAASKWDGRPAHETHYA